ncbi:hypothetical protein K6U64_17395 [Vibrio vulnificus]|nr:hypothetical protein [Vibrio vulnificus]MCG6264817.1 hypothetical protein [Vibrio vulnificus]HAS8560971.1 hypothetical protein [Vibrio vulnificus]
MEQTTVLIGNTASDSLGKLALSMAPDWPMITLTAIVGLTSYLTSKALIRVTKQNQKSTSKIKQAEIRQDWQKELRDSISKLIAATIVVRSKNRQSANFANTQDYYVCWEKILVLQSQIKLLLTNDKTESKSLVSLVDDLIEHAADSKLSVDDFAAYSNAVEEMAKKVLETAWEQIKGDLEK